MKELEIKHLSPYLPFGLEVMIFLESYPIEFEKKSKYFLKRLRYDGECTGKVLFTCEIGYYKSSTQFQKSLNDCILHKGRQIGFTSLEMIKNIKPILRPLSDIAKKIKIDNKEFIPLQVIGDLMFGDCKIWDYNEENKNYTVGFDKYRKGEKAGVQLACLNIMDFPESSDFKDVCFALFDDCAPENNGYKHAPISYSIFEKLFEWHFDVFSLIESGLAIDMNNCRHLYD